MFKKRILYSIGALFCVLFCTGSTWWSKDWKYRVSVVIDSGMYERIDFLVRYPLNLDTLTKEARATGMVSPLSFRVLEEKMDGVLVEVPSVYKSDSNSDTQGALIWMMDGNTPTMTERKYWIYFDTVDSEKRAPSYPAIPGADEVQGTNLLMNGGFEEVTDKGLPKGWLQINRTSLTKGTGAISMEEFHSGKRSFHISKPSLEGNSFMLAHGGWRSPAKVIPGRKYQVSGWIKATGKGQQCIQMTFVGEDWRSLAKETSRSYVFATGSGIHDWMKVSNVLVAPPGAHYVGVTLHLYQAEGDAWFDDIEIIEIPFGAPPTLQRGVVETRK